MQVLRFQHVIVTSAATLSIDAHGFGAYGLIVNVTSSVALSTYRILDSRTGSLLQQTLMAGQVGDASIQQPAWAYLPIIQGVLTLGVLNAGPCTFDLVFTDEPPRQPSGRWAVFQRTAVLAASGSSVLTTDFDVGLTRTFYGCLKSTRAGILTISYGNSADIIVGPRTLATIAGATGGVQFFTESLLNPWATYTLTNTDAALANTMSLLAYSVYNSV